MVGAVESAFAIKEKILEELSVQQVIDCAYNNYGCHGGSILSALEWLNKVCLFQFFFTLIPLILV